MEDIFSESSYSDMLDKLFRRFPSFQKAGAGAYKPGIERMEFADQLMGHPHRAYKIIHIAGTNGKGSVSNMLASVLAAAGYKVGLYTSPHILDFRERIRIVEDNGVGLIGKEDVWDFVRQWNDTFDHLDLSFFEITTLMALDWFCKKSVDVVVLETGLGGRLDSTNIVTPMLCVITNIGLDHCDLLGETLPEIAFEKAGIIKPKVPVVVGESHPEIDRVFERKVLYVNIPEPEYMGDRKALMSLLTFADKAEPPMWEMHGGLLARMDLQGDYQKRNLRTVLASIEVMKNCRLPDSRIGTLKPCDVADAIAETASRTDFHGRWEKLSDRPYVICDIGHNEHGLKYNFAQLEKLVDSGKFSRLIIVYGAVADKDVDAVIRLMPRDAAYVFTQADSRRALPAVEIERKFTGYRVAEGLGAGDVHVTETVADAVRLACRLAAPGTSFESDGVALIYVGGSTYVVAEAAAMRWGSGDFPSVD